MKTKHSLKKISVALALSFTTPVVVADSPFVPFTPLPLHYKAKPSQQVPANILVFMDNSRDASRLAQDEKFGLLTYKAGRIPEIGELGINKTDKKRIDVAKRTLKNVIKEFPQYRWGVSSYSKVDVSVDNYATDANCFEPASWYNSATLGCTYVDNFGDTITGNISQKLYQHEVGSELVAPIKTRNQLELLELNRQIDNIPVWGAANENASSAHNSPLTSAYYEMTRYYRGMRTAYKKQNIPAYARLAGNDKGEIPFTSVKGVEGKEHSAMRDGYGVQYVSPIQYRCQSNNIIIITSARDFYLSNYIKEKRAFYEPYHTDPLYKHDSQYSVPINSKDFNILAVSDLVSIAPTGTASSDYDSPYRRQYRLLRKYNDTYRPEGIKFTYPLPSLSVYIRPLNTVKYTDNGLLGDHIGGVDHYPPKDKLVGDYIYETFNPYMDIVDNIDAAEIALKNIRDYDGKQKSGAVENVFQRNAYNERTGLESYAHLAHDGDIIAKGNEYIYPWIDNKGKELSANITSSLDARFSTIGDQKAIINDHSGVPTIVDNEGKKWDGTDDKAQKDEKGNLIDYARMWSKQRINTYTIGFGTNPEAVVQDIESYPILTISHLGNVGQLYFEKDAEFEKVLENQINEDDVEIHTKPVIGGVLFVQDEGAWVPLITNKDHKGLEKGSIVKLTVGLTGGIAPGGGLWDYVTTNYRFDTDPDNKALGGEGKYEGGLLSVGDKVRIVPGDVAAEMIKPKVTGDAILSYTAQKGGGLYFSINKTDESSLTEALKQVLAHIDAMLVNMNVGSASTGILENSKINTAISVSLDSERWLSQVRFYERNPDGTYDLSKYTQPNYDKYTTVVSTPDGVCVFNENCKYLNNAAFNITAAAHAHGKGDLKIAVSDNKDEYKSLIKWLDRQTDSDRNDIFKRKLYGVEQLIYRDRDPSTPSIENARQVGDVLDSNIILFGDSEKATDKNTYMALGSNDGMVHIYRLRDRQSNAYDSVMNFIPGTAKRQNDKDTILRNLVYTAEQSYGTPGNTHQFFVNGKLFYRKTDPGPNFSSTDKHGLMTLVGTLAQGGRAVYALKVGGTEYNSTTYAGLDNDKPMEVPLWDTSSQKLGKAYEGVDENMGYVFGQAQVGRVEVAPRKADENGQLIMQDVRYATIVPSGFEPLSITTKDITGNESSIKRAPALFILDHLGINSMTGANDGNAGKLIKKIDTDYSALERLAPDYKAGLAAPMGVDLNRDGITDLVYAGDQNGNLWRFDIRGSDTSQWKAFKLFSGSPDKPITTAPAIHFNAQSYSMNQGAVYIGFGTGSNIYTEDLKSTKEQSIYGIVDYPNANCSDSKNAAWCKTRTEDDLQITQTISDQCQPTPDKPCVVVDRQNQQTETVGYRIFSQKVDENSHHYYDEKIENPNPYYGWKIDLVFNNKQLGERIVTDPSVVSDGNNRNASFIFTSTIYKDEGTQTDPTCTPEAIDTDAWVMTIDAKTGGNPKKININGFKSQDGTIIGGLYKTGFTTSTMVLGGNNVEISANSTLQSGVATRLDPNGSTKIPSENACPRGSQEILITSQDVKTGGSMSVVSVICGIPANFRRFSWREIF